MPFRIRPAAVPPNTLHFQMQPLCVPLPELPDEGDTVVFMPSYLAAGTFPWPVLLVDVP